MYDGERLGRAIEEAIFRKRVSRKEVARHFGVTPASITAWCKSGRIGKGKIEELIRYFSDTVPASHFGFSDLDLKSEPKQVIKETTSNSDEINQRIKQARKKIGLTQTQLAQKIGITTQAVQQWEDGSTIPRIGRLTEIAQALGVPVDWLQFGEQETVVQNKNNDREIIKKTKQSELTDISTFQLWSDEDIESLQQEYIFAPFYHSITFSGGGGSEEENDKESTRMPFSRYTLNKMRIHANSIVCAKADGDSMEPVISCTATIGIDTNDKNIRDGKIYAFEHGGLLRFKKLSKLPHGKIKIESFNPEYETEIESLDDINIVGRVFWWSHLDY